MKPSRATLARYLAEFVVVFLGVWLSLLAEQYREDRADRDRELQALAAIAADLESDSVVVAATIIRASAGITAGLRLMSGELDDSGLGALLTDMGVCSFTGNQRTSRYEALRTGELGYVRDEGLRTRIESLYFDSAARDYLHARDCDASERLFELIGPSVDMSVPSLERDDAIPGWGWNDRPVIEGAQNRVRVLTDPGIRSHVAVMTSGRQFLRGWLEREVGDRSAVRAEIRRYLDARGGASE